MPESPQIAPIEDEPSDELAVIEQPREGTLLWLQQQPHVEVLGMLLPDVHRVPEGSTLAPITEDVHCRVIRPTGKRCGAIATRSYGLCTAHLGGGSRDLAALGQSGRAARARLKMRRQLLGIGPSRAGNPRSHARLAALERAEQLAEALVIAPLDDPSLGTIERQRAAVLALDATFPLQHASIELELPASAAEVEGMSWEAMQRVAAQLADQ